MSPRFTGWTMAAIVSGTFLFLSSGCVATADGGYEPNVNVDVDVGLDYYDQFGFDYGTWGPGYAVGPYRGAGPRPRRGDGNPGHAGHGFRPAPASRGTPSIPSGPRAGGGRGH